MEFIEEINSPTRKQFEISSVLAILRKQRLSRFKKAPTFFPKLEKKRGSVGNTDREAKPKKYQTFATRLERVCEKVYRMHEISKPLTKSQSFVEDIAKRDKSLESYPQYCSSRKSNNSISPLKPVGSSLHFTTFELPSTIRPEITHNL